jgi:DNA-binding transcriptional LysR family regulator
VVALPTLLVRAVELLKQRSPQATVLVEEGDLARLLPKLRLGELDLFVGRLEPGYAAPDLVTEPLFNEPMVAVVPFGHALADKAKPTWHDLAQLPCVLPPPWASLRVKLEQQFHRHGLQPPTDLVETASFLALLAFLQRRGAAGFMAESVARYFEGEGEVQVLKLPVPVDVPPVGVITLRGRPLPTTTTQLLACLRQAAPAVAAGAPHGGTSPGSAAPPRRSTPGRRSRAA